MTTATTSVVTTPTTTIPTGTTTNASSVFEGKFVTARLFGMMTLALNGASVVYATEMAIASVPVTWNGTAFTGRLEETGAGEDVTDLVSGTLTGDGTTIVDMVYSRRIIRPNTQTGSFCEVKLRNLRLSGSAVPNALAGFQQDGDIRPYVTGVQYIDGNLDAAGNIVATTTYVGTDWTNSAAGQRPLLKVAIETVASQSYIIKPGTP